MGIRASGNSGNQRLPPVICVRAVWIQLPMKVKDDLNGKMALESEFQIPGNFAQIWRKPYAEKPRYESRSQLRTGPGLAATMEGLLAQSITERRLVSLCRGAALAR